jgi:hypothetical protein
MLHRSISSIFLHRSILCPTMIGAAQFFLKDQSLGAAVT